MSATSSISLSKISLTKDNAAISLEKKGASFDKIRINLNWNQGKSKGFFGFGKSKAIDLDLGAFVETIDGQTYAIQALGNSFGHLQRAPFTKLLGDDRTGEASDGEWLEINGAEWSKIKRVLVYTFIYEGAPNWRETDGVVRVMIPGHPEIEVKMNEEGGSKKCCAIAAIENDGGNLNISREVTFHDSQKPMDEAYGWGFRWTSGRK